MTSLTTFCVDLLEEEPDIEDCSVDLVVTSYPYKTRDGWSRELMIALGRLLGRVMRPGARLFFNGGQLRESFTRPFQARALVQKHSGLTPGQTIVWVKSIAIEGMVRGCHIADEDAKWLALFVDTEGEISISRSKAKYKTPGYVGQVSFYNTNVPLMREVMARFGEDVSLVAHQNGGGRTCYRVKLTSQRAAKLLRRLYPFLIAKGNQARCVVALEEGKGKAGITPPRAELDRRERLREICMALNKGAQPDVSSLPLMKTTVGHYQPLGTEKVLNYAWEPIFTFHKPPEMDLDRRAIGVPFADKSNLKRGTRGKHGDLHCAGDVWFIGYKTTGAKAKKASAKTKHAYGFPEELVERCIRVSGISEGSTVYDPFLGSGTTAVVAKRLGMVAVGSDRDRGALAVARERYDGAPAGAG